jgi:hypothetical protein
VGELRDNIEMLVVGLVMSLLVLSFVPLLGIPFMSTRQNSSLNSAAFSLECLGSFILSMPMKYYIDGTNGAEGKAAIFDALSLWADTPVALSFQKLTSSSGANVIFKVSNDGSGQGPAWTDANCMTHISTVHWNTYWGAQCSNTFNACVGAYAHEIGHAIGLAHDCDNNNLDLMSGDTCGGNGAPTTYVISPTNDEIAGAESLYGIASSGSVNTQGFNTYGVSGSCPNVCVNYGGGNSCGFSICPWVKNTVSGSGAQYSFVQQYTSAKGLPTDSGGNGAVAMMGETQINTAYRFGACICTSGAINSVSNRGADLEIDDYGVSFCITNGGGEICSDLASVGFGTDKAWWEIVWIKGNQWTPSGEDLLAAQVMDEKNNGFFPCGAIGPGPAYTPCGGHPSAYAEINIQLGWSQRYTYSSTSYFFNVGVWSDNPGTTSIATTNIFWNRLLMQ